MCDTDFVTSEIRHPVDREYLLHFIQTRTKMPLALRKYIDATPEIQRMILDMEDEIPRRTRVFGRPFDSLKEQWLGTPPGAGAVNLHDAAGSERDGGEGFAGRLLAFCVRRAKWIYVIGGFALIYGILYAMVFVKQ